MVKLVLYLVIPLLLVGIITRVVNTNPELYEYIPVVPFESEGEGQVKRGITVEIVDLFTLPKIDSKASQINQIIPYPGQPERLLYNDIRGLIGIIEDGSVMPTPFLDIRRLFGERFKVSNLEVGLLSFALHPDFLSPGSLGEGKIYTVHSETPSRKYMVSANPYFGLIEKSTHHLSIISEWQMASGNPILVDSASQRIVLIMEQPYYDHNIYHIAFNPTSQPENSDYGMLYVGVGDGGQAARLDRNKSTLFGKILRINPLGDGGPGYIIPPSNPFVSSRNMRPEVWAYGFRNPQRFSWDNQTGQMYVADIGEDHVEEINIVVRGENYGWSYFEGRYLVSGTAFEIVGEPILPPIFFPVNFPVADYDHQIGEAVAGGFVYRGEDVPQLRGRYVFGDISNGRIFYFDTNGIVPGDRPELFELSLIKNQQRVTMKDLVKRWRVDLRFAQDSRGELLLLNKSDNTIRKLAAPKH